MAAPSDPSEQLRRLHDLGGEVFVRQMIDLFVRTAPPRAGAVREGARAGDWRAVEHAAHSLKSSAGNVGADQVQALAERIEQLAAAGTTGEVAALAAELSHSLQQAIDRLTQYLEGRAP